jgi:methionine-rich copper-binding protein CopC
MTRMAVRTLLFFALSVLFIGPVLVQAHTHLHRSEPAEGSKLTTSPAEVTLWFSEDLGGNFSSVKVLNSAGQQVDNKDKQFDSKDHTLMRVTLPTLPPGVCKVIWRAVSVDTHATDGEFTFEVGQ